MESSKDKPRKLRLQYKHQVSYRHFCCNQYIKVPWLNLSGKWLEESGFSIGSPVEVEIKGNQIIITKIG